MLYSNTTPHLMCLNLDCNWVNHTPQPTFPAQHIYIYSNAVHVSVPLLPIPCSKSSWNECWHLILWIHIEILYAVINCHGVDALIQAQFKFVCMWYMPMYTNSILWDIAQCIYIWTPSVITHWSLFYSNCQNKVICSCFLYNLYRFVLVSCYIVYFCAWQLQICHSLHTY